MGRQKKEALRIHIYERCLDSRYVQVPATISGELMDIENTVSKRPIGLELNTSKFYEIASKMMVGFLPQYPAFSTANFRKPGLFRT